jgi:hypothetical protein
MKLKAGTEKEYAAYVHDNSQDSYSKAVLDYTERWAALMEAAMESGGKLEEIADKTSQEADTEGITGYMYGASVLALAYFWEYGEPLRRWHNLKTQLHNEGERANTSGGVLNPAILNIG